MPINAPHVMIKKAPLFFILLLPICVASQSFNCDGKIYFFRSDSGAVYLSYVDEYITPTPVIANVCNLTALGVVNQNALAANPFNNLLYFMTLSNYNLYSIDAACNMTLVCPSVANSHRACFDHLGRYWVIVGNDLQAYDINTCTMVKGPYPLSITPGADITFSLADCHFYMSSQNQLIKIDTNGTIVYQNNLGFGAGTGYGGIGIGVDGNLYGMPNVYDTLMMYMVDLTTFIPAGVAAAFAGSVANPCGCDMATFPCPVLNAAFSADPTAGCEPLDVNFTNLSSGLVNSWKWDFGDGTTDTINMHPSHAYTQQGTYQASLIVYAYSTCMYIKPDTFSLDINVYELPQADFTHGNACVNNSVAFSDASTPSNVNSWLWNFGDGSTSTLQNPTHIYNIVGTYNVSLKCVTSEGCADSITKQLTVYPLPTPSFTQTPICFNETSTFTDNSFANAQAPLSSWAWHFGDANTSTAQNPSHIYATHGSFNVTLTVQDTLGCTDSIQQTVIVHPKPNADFNFESQCSGVPIVFSNTSSVDMGNTITTWSWDFGDGNTSSVQSPTHTYQTHGIFTAELIISTNNACKDTAKADVRVYAIPNPSFSFSNICEGTTATFLNTSTIDASDTLASNIWNVGNATPLQTTPNASSLYVQPGFYNVTLYAISTQNCIDSVTQQLTVFDAPLASFTTHNVCLYDTVVFTNTSASPQFGSTGKWYWNFGDGSPTDSLNWHAQHLYNAAGIYNVSLIIQNDTLLCADTFNLNIEIYEPPQAAFQFVNACLNEAVIFTNLSQGSISSYNWNFGDASPYNNTEHPTHVYPQAGTYYVWLTVSDQHNCIDSVRQNVETYPLPVADFTFSDVCLNFSAVFTDASTLDAPDYINQWQWTLGDNSPTAQTQNVAHVYSASGPYSVQLIVNSYFGCSDTITHLVNIHPMPIVDFEADTQGCTVFCTAFNDLSSVTNGYIAQWQWDFGNNQLAQVHNPIICFTNNQHIPISYSVTLTVVTDKGCTASIYKPDYIMVLPKPIASFTIQPESTSLLEPLIKFHDTSFGAMWWLWNFGDNMGSSTLQNPVYAYQDTGHYIITLIVENQYHCFDTATGIVYIEPDWALYIPNAFTPNTDGLNDFFEVKGYGIIEFEMFIFSRWGQMVFYSNNMSTRWDGRVKDGKSGLIVPQAVFTYKINFTTVTGRKFTRYGHITVLASDTY